MKYLFATIALLLAVAGSSMALERIPTKMHNLAVSQTPCETCMTIVQDAEDYLASPSTQDTVVTFVQNDICPLLPQDSSRTCTTEARVFVAQAVASMEQAMPPESVCAYLGTCTSGILGLAQSAGLNSLSIGSFSVECPVCKMVVTNVLYRLRDPESREEIYQNALEACDELADPEGIIRCKNDVEQMFSALDDLLDDMDVGRACKVLQFCGDDKTSAPAGVVALRQVPIRLGDLQTTGDDQNCEACKSVISEADAILMDPNTQQEIMDFAKQGCDTFEDYKPQCIEYIDMYGPMVFGIAISYLQPVPFCTRLGYCTPTATAT